MPAPTVSVTRLDWGGGPVGDAVRASEIGRLRRFIKDEESEAIALFSPRHHTDSGDWYGEHAGKWLCATTLAYRRTGDSSIQESIDRIASFLAQQQEPDGYLGTYRESAACRFTSKKAPGVRTWDLWTHAWTIMGLLRAGKTDAAHRIGELILKTFPSVHPSILDLGNHSGLSSLVVLQPIAELFLYTGDERYIKFALDLLEQAEKRGLEFLSAERDVAEIGTGKAYQILWVLVGMVRLYAASGDLRLLESVEKLWMDVSREHLTPLGGPWGGIAAHKEVFNPAGFFSPYGMVETCSAATWLVLSRELFLLTGKPQYIEAVERTLLNTILGATDPNGQDWGYFTFPNGRRYNTYHWACCKSSGALALEEAASAAVTPYRDGVALNLFVPFNASIVIDGVPVTIDQDEGSITVTASQPVRFPLYIRQPGWGSVDIDCGGLTPLSRDGFSRLEKEWQNDRIALPVQTPIKVHLKTHTVDHHGQEIVRTDYACVSRGPYVYATGLIDGYKQEETLRLPRLSPESVFHGEGDRIDLILPARERIPFLPYYKARDWRTTWLQVAWQ